MSKLIPMYERKLQKQGVNGYTLYVCVPIEIKKRLKLETQDTLVFNIDENDQIVITKKQSD